MDTSDEFDGYLVGIHSNLKYYYGILEEIVKLFEKYEENTPLFLDTLSKFLKNIIQIKSNEVSFCYLRTYQPVFTNTVKFFPEFQESCDLFNNYINVLENLNNNYKNEYELLDYIITLQTLNKLNLPIPSLDLSSYFKEKMTPLYLSLKNIAKTPKPKLRGTVRKNLNISSGETF